MNLTDVALDIAAVSCLMFFAFIIRERVMFFRKCFIPVSLIAGVLGILVGPQVLGLVSPIHLTFSKSINQWVNFAFCFIFSTSFLGTTAKKFGRDILSTTCITGSIHMVQVVGGLLLAFAVASFTPGLRYELGLCPVAGFYGAHGSAGIIGGTYEQVGMPEGLGLAMTFATIGMFVAVVGGMALINWGAKKGYTKKEIRSEDFNKFAKSGIIPTEERKPIGLGIADTAAIDPFAFQFMIVGVVIGVSYLIRIFMISIIPFWTRIPLYTMCLLIGFIIGQMLSKTKYNSYIDRGSMKRISGLALEYVIAVAIATIQIKVLAQYFVYIVAASVILCSITAYLSIYLSKHWYGDDWFEAAMGIFGQTTGNLSTGLLLIKVLDPDGETLAAESISGSSTLGSCFQLPYTTMGPIVMVAAPAMFFGGSIALLIAFFTIGFLVFRIKKEAIA